MYKTLTCDWRRIRLVPHLLKRHYCVSRSGVGGGWGVPVIFSERLLSPSQKTRWWVSVITLPPRSSSRCWWASSYPVPNIVTFRTPHFCEICILYRFVTLFLLRTPRHLYLLLPFLMSWPNPCTFPCPLPTPSPNFWNQNCCFYLLLYKDLKQGLIRIQDVQGQTAEKKVLGLEL